MESDQSSSVGIVSVGEQFDPPVSNLIPEGLGYRLTADLRPTCTLMGLVHAISVAGAISSKLPVK